MAQLKNMMKVTRKRNLKQTYHEFFFMSRMSCETGLKCWNTYLVKRELPAAIGRLGLEGPEANLRNRCWRANTTWGKVISSRNQMFTNDKRLVVQLPDYF